MRSGEKHAIKIHVHDEDDKHAIHFHDEHDTHAIHLDDEDHHYDFKLFYEGDMICASGYAS